MKWRLLASLMVLSLGLMCGCGVPQSDYDSLNAENEKLKKEIEDLKYGADKMLLTAKAYLGKKDYSNARKELALLISRHKGTKQADEAEVLLLEISGVAPEPSIATADTFREIQPVASAKLRTVTEKKKGITWFYDLNTTKNKNTNSVHLYYGKSTANKLSIRLRIQYATNDRIYLQGFYVKADNSSYNISVKPGEIESDNSYDGNSECYDGSLTKEKYEIVKAIINSQNTTIRCIGKKVYDDITVTESEKQGLKNVLDAYFAAGGRISNK